MAKILIKHGAYEKGKWSFDSFLGNPEQQKCALHPLPKLRGADDSII